MGFRDLWTVSYNVTYFLLFHFTDTINGTTTTTTLKPTTTELLPRWSKTYSMGLWQICVSHDDFQNTTACHGLHALPFVKCEIIF